jgi:hypothetical protein
MEPTQDGRIAITQLRRITAQSRERDSNIDSAPPTAASLGTIQRLLEAFSTLKCQPLLDRHVRLQNLNHALPSDDAGKRKRSVYESQRFQRGWATYAARRIDNGAFYRANSRSGFMLPLP